MRVMVVELASQDAGVITCEPMAHRIPEGSTVKVALVQLGFDETLVNQWLSERAIAIFGKYALADTVLYEGDRLEILDKLRFDPKESRRRRAQHKQHYMPGQKKMARRSGKQS